jgi:hypothetical protein
MFNLTISPFSHTQFMSSFCDIFKNEESCRHAVAASGSLMSILFAMTAAYALVYVLLLAAMKIALPALGCVYRCVRNVCVVIWHHTFGAVLLWYRVRQSIQRRTPAAVSNANAYGFVEYDKNGPYIVVPSYGINVYVKDFLHWSPSHSLIPRTTNESIIARSRLEKVPKMRDGLVCIEQDNGDGLATCIGMGSRVTLNGVDCLLTAVHVLYDASKAPSFINRDGKSVPIDKTWKIIAINASADYAFLQVPTTVFTQLGVKSLRLGRPTAARKEPVHVYGMVGSDPHVSIGLLQVLPGSFLEAVHSASTVPSFSGSPLLSPRGDIMGVHLGRTFEGDVNRGTLIRMTRLNESPASSSANMELSSDEYEQVGGTEIVTYEMVYDKNYDDYRYYEIRSKGNVYMREEVAYDDYDNFRATKGKGKTYKEHAREYANNDYAKKRREERKRRRVGRMSEAHLIDRADITLGAHQDWATIVNDAIDQAMDETGRSQFLDDLRKDFPRRPLYGNGKGPVFQTEKPILEDDEYVHVSGASSSSSIEVISEPSSPGPVSQPAPLLDLAKTKFLANELMRAKDELLSGRPVKQVDPVVRTLLKTTDHPVTTRAVLQEACAAVAETQPHHKLDYFSSKKIIKQDDERPVGTTNRTQVENTINNDLLDARLNIIADNERNKHPKTGAMDILDQIDSLSRMRKWIFRTNESGGLLPSQCPRFWSAEFGKESGDKAFTREQIMMLYFDPHITRMFIDQFVGAIDTTLVPSAQACAMVKEMLELARCEYPEIYGRLAKIYAKNESLNSKAHQKRPAGGASKVVQNSQTSQEVISGEKEEAIPKSPTLQTAASQESGTTKAAKRRSRRHGKRSSKRGQSVENTLGPNATPKLN